MRILVFCGILALLLGCDTLGGRTVVLNLKPRTQGNTTVEQALLVVDETMGREGIKRVAAPSPEYGHVANYVGGHFICGASTQDGKLVVDFRNPHFGGGPPDADVMRVSDAVAEDLRSHYGAKQVRIKK
jgi:hypothetical protein